MQDKIKFIREYINAENAATGSKFDANANVTSKNICTLQGELFKGELIKINRMMMKEKITQEFGSELADEYIRQLEAHEIYAHDETSIMPYCASVTMYPLLLDGLVKLGGESKAPRNLASFCGIFVNFVFAVSSQFAGAVATVEFLAYMDYFARQEYGDNYLETHSKVIDAHLQQVVYSLNQPAAARNYQSVFWNISIYDENYFESLLGDLIFPETFGKCDYNSIKKLQEHFLTWFNNEREKAVLTFPVVTAAMLVKEGKPVDTEFAMMCAGQAEKGSSFFVYQSETADSLASCCRLRNEFTDNTFSYSLGAGGIATGSTNVITINFNRLVQDGRDVKTEVEKVQKYQVAHRKIMEDFQAGGLLPVYDAGFIAFDKQFLTIGINGMVEAAEFKGLEIGDNEEYYQFLEEMLKPIYDSNKEAKKQYGYMFNTEFVPAENLGVKNAQWDKDDGYVVPRDCYNSYFYVVEDETINPIDKFKLHGSRATKFLDGGSALHLNLEEALTRENYYHLLCISAKTGCNYFCVNVKITICNSCDSIDKRTLQECPKCGSRDIDYGTRVIGYLKRVSAFSSARQKEHALRHYHLT